MVVVAFEEQWERFKELFPFCAIFFSSESGNQFAHTKFHLAPLVRASDRHAADAGSIPRCGKGFFFSQSHLSVQTLLRVSVHPHVQTHAFTSVRTLKTL